MVQKRNKQTNKETKIKTSNKEKTCLLHFIILKFYSHVCSGMNNNNKKLMGENDQMTNAVVF
jgi:hypothetical protein